MVDLGHSISGVIHILLNIFCYILIGGWCLLATFHLVGLVYGFYKFHRKPSPSNLKELPGISIIKPLTSIDANLYENLKTFFNLQYPRYEILFCVQEHDNDLLEMIERLRNQHPHIQSQLFVRSQKCPFNEKLSKPVNNDVKNPKISNMIPAYEKAQYPLILISDSGLMMHENTLYDMALCMTDGVGLVHQMPFTCDRKGFAGSVEKVYFGTQHARMYMTINLIGINCVTGMSCLIRKECIDRVGGLRAFGQYIAEDYYIAYEVAKQGWKLRVAPTPAQQNSGEYSVSTWIDRMIRWCKLRMRLSPVAYLEPLQECFCSAILAGLLTNYLFEWNALVVAACHILIWFIFDYLMLRITQGGPLPFSKFEFAIAWLVREFSSFYIYFKAFTGSSTIKWRGKEYRLGSGTKAEDLSSSPSSSSMPSLLIDATSAPSSSLPSASSSSSSASSTSSSGTSSSLLGQATMSNSILPGTGQNLLSMSAKQASQFV